MVDKKWLSGRRVWIGIGVLSGIFLAALIIIRLYNPEFDNTRFIRWALIGAGVFGGLAAVIYFTSRKAAIMRQNGDKLPAPITFAEAQARAERALRDPRYMDEVDIDEPTDVGVVEMGRKSELVFKYMGTSKYVKGRKYAMGINMHYPDILKRIMVDPKNDYEIQRMLQKCVMNAAPEMEIKETVRINPDTGLVITTKEPVAETEKETEKPADPLDAK